ncbi:hypothetical protein [Halosimplex sp. J119]
MFDTTGGEEETHQEVKEFIRELKNDAIPWVLGPTKFENWEQVLRTKDYASFQHDSTIWVLFLTFESHRYVVEVREIPPEETSPRTVFEGEYQSQTDIEQKVRDVMNEMEAKLE